MIQVPRLGHFPWPDVVRRLWSRGCRRRARQLPGLGRPPCPAGTAARARLARHQQLHTAHPAACAGIRQLWYVTTRSILYTSCCWSAAKRGAHCSCMSPYAEHAAWTITFSSSVSQSAVLEYVGAAGDWSLNSFIVETPLYYVISLIRRTVLSLSLIQI